MKYTAIQYIHYVKNYSAVLYCATAFVLLVWTTSMLLNYSMAVSKYSLIPQRSRSILKYLLSVKSHFRSK
jgi:hypothetical protein